MAVCGMERGASSWLARCPGLWWRQRLYVAWIVRWRGAELDRRLAEGSSPDANAALTLHTKRITDRRGRTRVAAGLARVRRDAHSSRPGFSAAVRPHPGEVLAAGAVLDTLERRLAARERVTARGVALLRVLLMDGSSALYRPCEPGALGSELRAAAAALEPTDERAGWWVG
jgi:hypothetical protein